MYIYQLSRIHNTSLVSVYYGLDKRECKCLEYLLYKPSSWITDLLTLNRHRRIQRVWYIPYKAETYPY
jgi:hypothetical protein